jgi:hypothetical protein
MTFERMKCDECRHNKSDFCQPVLSLRLLLAECRQLFSDETNGTLSDLRDKIQTNFADHCITAKAETAKLAREKLNKCHHCAEDGHLTVHKSDDEKERG